MWTNFQKSVYFTTQNLHKLFITLLILLSLNINNVTASSIQILSINDGLSQSDIYSIVQDDLGFIWFATRDGLNRYDGYNFKIYRPDKKDPKNSLSHQAINILLKSQDGTLWIGTENGLNRYFPKMDAFEHYLPPPDSSVKPNQGFKITCIKETPNGDLIVGTNNKGIYRFNTHFKKYESISFLNIPEKNITIESILVEETGEIWTSVENHGIYIYNSDLNQFQQAQIMVGKNASLEQFIIKSYFLDSNHNLWVGTNEGLILIDNINGKAKHFQLPTVEKHKNLSNSIVGIAASQEGILWVINEPGDIYLINPQTMQAEQYFINDYRYTSLPNNRISSFYLDDSGILWLGTTGTGVVKLDANRNYFNSMSFSPWSSNSLSDNVVWSIHQQKNGTLWVGTDAGGLNKIEPINRQAVHYQYDPEKPGSISDNQVMKVFEDKQGQIWIGTGAGGLNKYNPKNETFSSFRHKDSNPNSISHDRVYSIYEDLNHNFWIGTEKGLNKFNRKTQKFTHFYHNPQNPNSLVYDRVGAIIEADSGELWIGTLGGGISRYNYKNDTFRNYKHDPNNKNSLQNEYILSLFKDNSNNIWICTWGGGLLKYNSDNDSFITILENNQTGTEAIHGIEQDELNNLWISTNKGLIKLNPITYDMVHYTHTEGLINDEFNTGAHFKNENGDMYFGSIGGLIWFSPSKIKKNDFIPPVVFTDFQILNESINHKEIRNNKKVLDHTITSADTIQLSYHDKIISFEFAALNYFASDKNQYAYKMAGVDEDWIYSGNRRFATYTNLNPGHYTFHVKASNNDGIWNEKGSSIWVIMSPPFWMTMWFRILFSTLVVSIIMGMYILQTRSIKERNAELMSFNNNLESEIKERKRIEHELREQKIFLDNVLNGVQEGIGIVDEHENFLYLNNAFAELLGHPVDELMTKSLLEIFPPSTHKIIMEETKKKKKGLNTTYELNYLHPSGEKKYFRTSSSPMYNDEGEFSGSIGAVLDITDLVTAEEKRKIMEAQLRHAQKMETIGTLAGGIAHDFNNILVPIIGYAEMSIDLVTSNDILKSNLEKILKASKRAKDLVQQILTFSRQEQKGLETVSIKNLVNEALRLLRSSLPSTIEIDVKIEKDTGYLLADPTQIHQVIMNLCTNAFHAMRENGGTLGIHLSNKVFDKDEAAKFSHLQANRPYVSLRVSDTGKGMDGTIITRIFEPFFTTKKVGEGTGLGLSAVHGIVLSHGGDIQVKSTPQVGTTFEIYFPQHTEKAEKFNNKISDKIPKGNEHILFVDDEVEIVLLYQQILESLGYVVTTFTESEKALELFQQNPDEFNLVITDHTMPHLTGTELSKKLLNIRPDIPIIMCTGYSESVTQEKAKQIGIREFILKPLTMSNIAKAIRDVLDSAFKAQIES